MSEFSKTEDDLKAFKMRVHVSIVCATCCVYVCPSIVQCDCAVCCVYACPSFVQFVACVRVPFMQCAACTCVHRLCCVLCVCVSIFLVGLLRCVGVYIVCAVCCVYVCPSVSSLDATMWWCLGLLLRTAHP